MLFTLHILTSLAPLVSKPNALFLVKEFICQNFVTKETIHIIRTEVKFNDLWFLVVVWFFRFCSFFFGDVQHDVMPNISQGVARQPFIHFFLHSIICLSFTTGELRWPWSVHKMICVRYINVIRKFRILVAIVEILLIQNQMLIENLWPRYIRERADWKPTISAQFRPNWSAFGRNVLC